MKMDFQGKVVVVTGGGGSIGSAVARGFLQCEAGKVHLLDINESNLQRVYGELNAEFPGRVFINKVDLSKVDDIRRVVEKIVSVDGKVDILINHAGVNRRKPALEVTEEDWDFVLNVNLKGLFFMAQEVGKYMAQKGGGVIVNTASVSSVRGHPNLVAYAASKGGVMQVTKVLANEWTKFNIRVNAIAPGYVYTGQTKDYLSDESIYRSIVSKIPMRRIGEVSDIVGAVLFLSSDLAKYITGHLLFIDGGRTID